MGTAAFNTAGAGSNDRAVTNAAIQSTGDVLMITNGTDGTAADGSDAGTPGVGHSPKTSAGSNAGSGLDAEEETSTAIVVAERGTIAATAAKSNMLFPSAFVAQAPLPVIGNIFQYADGKGLGVFLDNLTDAAERVEFIQAYLRGNFSVLETVVYMCRDADARDTGKRLLAGWTQVNRAYVDRCSAEATAEKALQPPHRLDNDGESVFNHDAIFWCPAFALAMDNWPMLNRLLSAGRLDVNAKYNTDATISGAGGIDTRTFMESLLVTSVILGHSECFKGLLDHDDIDLYRPEHGKTSLSSSPFGRILWTEAFRSGPLAKGDMDLTEHFLRHHKCDVNMVSENGYVPLHWSLIALTSRNEENGSFEKDLNRCIGSIAVLVSGGADIDGGAANQLSPQAFALNGIMSENPAIAARYHLALAAMRGHVDLVDCCGGLELDEKIISRLLSHRRRLLVGDIALYQPKPGKTSLITSSFGRILLAEALRSDPLEKGDMELTKHFLRRRKCDVNMVSEDGSVPLHWSLAALTSRIDGSFENDINRCIGSIAVLVSGGADIDGGAANQLSPRAVALDGIVSADAATAARCHLALAVMRGKLDLTDCSRGLEKTEAVVSCLLSHRLGFLVGPFLFARRARWCMHNFVHLFSAFGVFGTTA